MRIKIKRGSPMSDQIARNAKQLGAILRRARKLEGISQSDLGERIHMRQGTISRLETGAPDVQLHTVTEILYALKLELVVRPRTKGGGEGNEDIF
jgi:HTH-type transcriptional regulator / antitoxin HipB